MQFDIGTEHNKVRGKSPKSTGDKISGANMPTISDDAVRKLIVIMMRVDGALKMKHQRLLPVCPSTERWHQMLMCRHASSEV